MKHKVIAHNLQRTHWWVMAHLERQGRLAKKKKTPVFNIKREKLESDGFNRHMGVYAPTETGCYINFVSLDFLSF